MLNVLEYPQTLGALNAADLTSTIIRLHLFGRFNFVDTKWKQEVVTEPHHIMWIFLDLSVSTDSLYTVLQGLISILLYDHSKLLNEDYALYWLRIIVLFFMHINFWGSYKNISGYFGTCSHPQCSWLLYNCDQLSTLTAVSKHPLLALCVPVFCACINTTCAYLNWRIYAYVVFVCGLCMRRI